MKLYSDLVKVCIEVFSPTRMDVLVADGMKQQILGSNRDSEVTSSKLSNARQRSEKLKVDLFKHEHLCHILTGTSGTNDQQLQNKELGFQVKDEKTFLHRRY